MMVKKKIDLHKIDVTNYNNLHKACMLIVQAIYADL